MYKLALGIAAGLLLFSNNAMALCSSYPYTLTNGATADATQVMANFNCAALTSGATLVNVSQLGIGTASPISPLHVVGGAGATGRIYSTDNTAYNTSSYSGINTLWLANLSATAGTGSGVGFAVQGAGPGSVASIAGISTAADYSSALVFQTRTSGGDDGERVRITATGNVGIGTTSPSYLLHVNGTAYATGAAGALSDIRHKRDIAALPDGALGDVIRLHPVLFHWRDPKDAGMQGRQMGFIAQDVEKILPSVVLTEANAEKTKGLKYNELIALLTKAIQEQQAEIATLRTGHARQVSALEAANDNQLREMAALRAKFDSLERSVRVRSAAR